MTVYKGKAGVDALRAKIDAQCKAVVAISAIGIAHHLIDASPVGLEEYPPGIENEPGDFKNSWAVGVGKVNKDTGRPDPSGGDAFVQAYNNASKYNLQDNVYVTNSVEHAQQVENGWSASDPFRAELGWGDEEGYAVVARSKDDALRILRESVERAKKVTSINDIF